VIGADAVGHSLGVTDANGFYQFSSDLTNRGGVWLKPGKLTSVVVPTGVNYEDSPWVDRSLALLITDDTRLDVELVRGPRTTH